MLKKKFKKGKYDSIFLINDNQDNFELRGFLFKQKYYIMFKVKLGIEKTPDIIKIARPKLDFNSKQKPVSEIESKVELINTYEKIIEIIFR